MTNRHVLTSIGAVVVAGVLSGGLAPAQATAAAAPAARAVVDAGAPCEPTTRYRLLEEKPELTAFTTFTVPARTTVTTTVTAPTTQRLRVRARYVVGSDDPVSPRLLARTVRRAEQVTSAGPALVGRYVATSAKPFRQTITIRNPLPHRRLYAGFKGAETVRFRRIDLACGPGGVSRRTVMAVRTFGIRTTGTLACSAPGQLDAVGQKAQRRCRAT